MIAFAHAAHANPTDNRVLLADNDPELRRAVESSLKPWRIEVVVDVHPPPDLAGAEARAEGNHARFVVWREGAELVVFDHDTAALERRIAQAGAFDAPAAAAAALTVKTMMRLPPPPAEDPTPQITKTVPPPPPPPDLDGVELRIDGMIGSRYEVGLDSTFALRFGARALVRPWRDLDWRFGLLGDFGAAASVEQAGFRGTWSNWSALATASFEPLQDVETWAAVGLEHSSLDGTEMATPRVETKTLLALRAGVIVRWHVGPVTVGTFATLETLGSTVTYTKMHSSAAIFEIPQFGLVGGVMVGTDIIP